MCNIKLDKNGFTLIEMMVIVAIIGVILGIGIPNLIRARQETVEQICLSNIRVLQTAVELARTQPGVDVTNLPNAAALKPLLVPTYMLSMPDCPFGNFSTDENGDVHCSQHAP